MQNDIKDSNLDAVFLRSKQQKQPHCYIIETMRIKYKHVDSLKTSRANLKHSDSKLSFHMLPNYLFQLLQNPGGISETASFKVHFL